MREPKHYLPDRLLAQTESDVNRVKQQSNNNNNNNILLSHPNAITLSATRRRRRRRRKDATFYLISTMLALVVIIFSLSLSPSTSPFKALVNAQTPSQYPPTQGTHFINRPHQPMQTTVPVKAAPGTVVYRLQARSDNPNAHIRYYLVHDQANDRFEVDERTGEVRTRGVEPFQSDKEYKIYVRAEDKSRPGNSAAAKTPDLLLSIIGGRQSDELLVCADGWSQFGTHCYRFFAQRRSWQRAKDTCERYGSKLALVYDYQQNNFTTQLAFSGLLGAGSSSSDSSSQVGSSSSSLSSSQSHQSAHNALLSSAGPSSSLSSSSSQSAPVPLYSSDERSYWIGFKAIDRLETNTLESSANTFVSKYIGFWDFDEPRASSGECVRAAVRHETGSASPYRLIVGSSSQATGKWNWKSHSN